MSSLGTWKEQKERAKQGLAGATKTAQRGNKTTSFEKIKRIVYGRGGAAGINTVCSLQTALRLNHMWPHAYLEGFVDERDPRSRC
ncbi:hypothetical protein PoB_006393200 [Plakobranchus ocellatus]|uniref:Uncharacterized protein n=1 Tax=Plakobranchus ocellatus TaxID=259542 RepID=A0AAV4CZR6_9GAST|nr:hypothetical protein PoB_006393200 [Plakobranchus ocellatus]